MSPPVEPGTGGSDDRGRSPEAGRVVILVPCFDEAPTVGDVVRDFAREVPEAAIYVIDNNSTDETARLAAEAGAHVLTEKRQGKGHVVSGALARIDADLYVMVDGDGTYPADRVRDLVAPILDGRADHVVGRRIAKDASAYRAFHTMGNRLVTFLVNRIFGTALEDVMSGYRAFTREVARTVPLVAAGFDIESEFTLQTLEKAFVLEEIDVAYLPRPAGSESKLSTFRDGGRVLLRIATILKDFRPMAFFTTLSVGTLALSGLCGWPPIADYIEKQYVDHVPLAVLAAALGVVGLNLLGVGVVLTTINARFRELHALRRRDVAAEGDAATRRPATRR